MKRILLPAIALLLLTLCFPVSPAHEPCEPPSGYKLWGNEPFQVLGINTERIVVLLFEVTVNDDGTAKVVDGDGNENTVAEDTPFYLETETVDGPAFYELYIDCEGQLWYLAPPSLDPEI